MTNTIRNGPKPSLTRDQIEQVVNLYFQTNKSSKQVALMFNTSPNIISYYWAPLAVPGQRRKVHMTERTGTPEELRIAKRQLAREIARAKTEMRDPRTPIYDPDDLEY